MTDNKSLSYLMDIDKVNKEKFSQVISDIENLKTEVSNIKSKVDSSLPVDISSVNTSISDVKNVISGVSTKVDGVGTSVNAVSNNISILRPPIKATSSWGRASGAGMFYKISGASGRLDYAIIGPLSHGRTITLTIDGVPYKVKKTSTATTGMNCFFGSHDSPYFILEDDPSSHTRLLVSFYGTRARGDLNAPVAFDREKVLLFSRSGMYNPASTSGMNLTFSVTDSSVDSLCYLAKDIIFENSLEISLSAGQALGAPTVDGVVVVSLFQETGSEEQ